MSQLPPFVHIDGVINFRTLPLKAKPSWPGLYRSGEISRITTTGKEQLRALGIRKVIDLRSPREIARFHTTQPQIDGVEVVTMPALTIEKKEDLTDAYARFASAGDDGFMELYSEILDQGASAFKSIFEHIRDKPEDGLLVHCTAGKDRTGMAAALILLTAGVEDEAIVADYVLTTAGLEPAREMILARFSAVPGFHEDTNLKAHAFGSRPSTMVTALNMIRTKYGGAEAYLTKFCGFSVEDITIIKENLKGDR